MILAGIDGNWTMLGDEVGRVCRWLKKGVSKGTTPCEAT